MLKTSYSKKNCLVFKLNAIFPQQTNKCLFASKKISVLRWKKKRHVVKCNYKEKTYGKNFRQKHGYCK